MKNKAPFKLPLIWGLLGIIVSCWIVPVFIIIFLSNNYINKAINDQILDTIAVSADSSMQLTLDRLEYAISASRTASYDSTIRNAYENYVRTSDKLKLSSIVSGFLRQQYKYDEMFLTAALYFKEEPETVYYTYNDATGSTGVNYYSTYIHELVRQVSVELNSTIRYLYQDGHFYIIRNILDNNFNPYAVLTLELNINHIFYNFKNLSWEKNGSIWVDDTLVVLYPESKGFLTDEFLNNVVPPEIISDGKGIFYQGNFIYVYQMQYNGNVKLAYIVELDMVEIKEDLAGYGKITIIMSLCMMPLIFFALWFLFRHIFKPITQLEKMAKIIELGNVGHQIETEFYNREFEYLGESFNSMSRQLELQFERIYSEELALRDAKITALQSQINAHFLNNTLEIINWEARIADNYKVSRMIECLGIMLDAAMDRENKPIVPLLEEVKYVDAYLYIISERFGDRLTVKKEIDESILNKGVPRLILQPLIENAVVHGIEKKRTGLIVVRGYRENERIILEIENDGALTNDDSEAINNLLNNTSEGTHNSMRIGIYNVNQRLKMLYGVESGLDIRTNSEGNTVSRIVIFA